MGRARGKAKAVATGLLASGGRRRQRHSRGDDLLATLDEARPIGAGEGVAGGPIEQHARRRCLARDAEAAVAGFLADRAVSYAGAASARAATAAGRAGGAGRPRRTGGAGA